MLDKPYWPERLVGISISEERAPGGVFKRWGWWDRGADLGSLLAQSAGSFISRLHNKLPAEGVAILCNSTVIRKQFY